MRSLARSRLWRVKGNQLQLISSIFRHFYDRCESFAASSHAMLFILLHDKIQLWSYFIIKCIYLLDSMWCAPQTHTHSLPYLFRSIFTGEMSGELRWRWKREKNEEIRERRGSEYIEFANCHWHNGNSSCICSSSTTRSQCPLHTAHTILSGYVVWTWARLPDTHLLLSIIIYSLPFFFFFFRSLRLNTLQSSSVPPPLVQ